MKSADAPTLLARLLAKKPRAMLFEEPIASLRPGAVREVLPVIWELGAAEVKNHTYCNAGDGVLT
jgi:ABC-type polar amino acid transport system ATPase subunit